MSNLHFFLSLLMVVSSIFLILMINPVYSVLLLILIFFFASMSIFLFGVDFLGLLFIIIYVGAIAVLFLFVVMMLDLKQRFTLSHSRFLIWCFFSSGLIIFFIIYSSNLLSIFKFKTSPTNLSMLTLDSFNNTEVLGQCLFNYYLLCFLIAGFILLLALISAVALTQRYNSHQKNQFSSKQLSRTSIFLSFFASNKKN